MELNDEVRQRLVEIIKYSKLSKRQFTLSLGLPPSSLGKILNGKTRALSNTIITVLELKYGINPIWLETGESKKYKDVIVTLDKDEAILLEQSRLLSDYNGDLLKLFLETLLKKQTEKEEEEKAQEKSRKRKDV